MSERRDMDYLGDIVEAMERIVEATKGLPTDWRNRYRGIPWKGLAGVGDKMIHHYFGLNYDVIWTIASEEIPTLLPQVREVLAKETS